MARTMRRVLCVRGWWMSEERSNFTRRLPAPRLASTDVPSVDPHLGHGARRAATAARSPSSSPRRRRGPGGRSTVSPGLTSTLTIRPGIGAIDALRPGLPSTTAARRPTRRTASGRRRSTPSTGCTVDVDHHRAAVPRAARRRRRRSSRGPMSSDHECRLYA